jgi:23S rRNA-/tRNA-specific pseudouridylate synthase
MASPESRNPTAELEILFEDNHVIVINKRASDIVQGDKTGDETLPDKIKAKVRQAGKCFLWGGAPLGSTYQWSGRVCPNQ